MMFETILICISIIILILASIFDLKTREIPDTLSYYFLVGILGSILIFSMFTSFYYFVYALIGASIYFGIFYILYLLKQIGGGDVKILASIGAILANLELLGLSLSIIFLFLLLFVGGTYSMIWGLVLFFKNYKEARQKFVTILRNLKYYRLILLIIALSLFIISFFLTQQLKLLFLLIILLTLSMFYLFIFIKVVESIHFIKKMKVEQLTDGDWLSKDVYINEKLICSSKKPCLDKKQIQELKNHKIKTVLIKIGIPFVPAILISFIITIIFYGIL